ncbi:hypothetical protein BJ508DRAFT_315760 [Ascobolus immersus RN42]|uniref:Uncharacterized protein n=1 Tax=Ascobolus immersus RN42 TaxID=1160509 RepID=A0A3N4HFV2_ASCIM|nr:hypothetical protein BJ508DRAFT_315760 [Ascobolus immersus RN42]
MVPKDVMAQLLRDLLENQANLPKPGDREEEEDYAEQLGLTYEQTKRAAAQQNRAKSVPVPMAPPRSGRRPDSQQPKSRPHPHRRTQSPATSRKHTGDTPFAASSKNKATASPSRATSANSSKTTETDRRRTDNPRTDLIEENRALHQALEMMKDRYTKKQIAFQTAKEDAKAAREESNCHRNAIEKAKEEAIALCSALELYKSKLEAKTAAHKSTREELRNIKAAYEHNDDLLWIQRRHAVGQEEKMKALLAKSETEKTQLAEKLAKSETEKTQLAEKLAKSETERTQLAEKLAKSETDKTQLAEKLAKSETEKAQLTEKLRRFTETFEFEKGKVLEERAVENELVKKRLEETETSANRYRLLYEESLNESERMGTLLHELKKYKSVAEEKVEEVEAMRGEMKKQNTTIQKIASASQTKSGEIERLRDVIQRNEEGTSSELSRLNLEVCRLSAEYKKTSAEMGVKDARLAEYGNEKLILAKKLAELEDVTKKERAKLEEELKVARSAGEIVKEDMLRLHSKIGYYKTLVASLSGSREKLKEQLQMLKNERAQLKERLDDLDTSSRVIHQQLRERSERMVSDIEHLEYEVQELRDERKRADDKLVEMLKVLDAFQEQQHIKEGLLGGPLFSDEVSGVVAGVDSLMGGLGVESADSTSDYLSTINELGGRVSRLIKETASIHSALAEKEKEFEVAAQQITTISIQLDLVKEDRRLLRELNNKTPTLQVHAGSQTQDGHNTQTPTSAPQVNVAPQTQEAYDSHVAQGAQPHHPESVTTANHVSTPEPQTASEPSTPSRKRKAEATELLACLPPGMDQHDLPVGTRQGLQWAGRPVVKKVRRHRKKEEVIDLEQLDRELEEFERVIEEAEKKEAEEKEAEEHETGDGRGLTGGA